MKSSEDLVMMQTAEDLFEWGQNMTRSYRMQETEAKSIFTALQAKGWYLWSDDDDILFFSETLYLEDTSVIWIPAVLEKCIKVYEELLEKREIGEEEKILISLRHDLLVRYLEVINNT